jgi:hypothetical protein
MSRSNRLFHSFESVIDLEPFTSLQHDDIVPTFGERICDQRPRWPGTDDTDIDPLQGRSIAFLAHVCGPR